MAPTLLTDAEYERLMREGSKEYSNQQFLRSWYFYFDKINKSNKKSVDSLENAVFCLMKAGEVRPYFFSETKFTDIIQEIFSEILAFEPNNLEVLDLKAKFYIKQGLLWKDYADIREDIFEKAYTTLLQFYGQKRRQTQKDDLETKFRLGEVLLHLDDREQDAVKIFEDILASPIQKSSTLLAKVHTKLADTYYKSVVYKKGREKIYESLTLHKIFDTNDPTIAFRFAQVEYEFGNLKSSLTVCKWLLQHHYTKSELWNFLAEIFEKLGNEKYADFALSTARHLEIWVDQSHLQSIGSSNELRMDDPEWREAYEQEADFYDFVSEQAFSKEKMREHMEKIITIAPLSQQFGPYSDEIMELPGEERSFANILAGLEEEDIYYTELGKEIEEDEQVAQFEENELEERITRRNPSYDNEEYEALSNEDSQKFDEYIAQELEVYGLTDEEISAYQSLPD